MKDVERAFGVLQAWFAIVRGPVRFFYHETLQDIMKACVILHNMIIEDERDETEVVDLDYEQTDEISCTPMSREPTNEFTEFIQVHQCIRDREVHSQLQMNLVEHLWQLQGESRKLLVLFICLIFFMELPLKLLIWFICFILFLWSYH